MPFELRIALRYLTARRKQAFISLISGVSMLGVLVGVMALMVALGLMTGLQAEIRTKILGATAHLSIFKSRSEAFDDYREVVERVRALPRRAGGGAGGVRQGRSCSSSTGASPVTLKGIVPAAGADGHRARAARSRAPRWTRSTAATADLPPVLLGRDLASTWAWGRATWSPSRRPRAGCPRWACCRG